MSDKEETRERILEAAMARIKHYGYSKTTMSEIAKDCDMSAGNIYRFFKSKIDIAEAMANEAHEEMSAQLRKIASKSICARQRLHDLFDYALSYSFEKLDSDAKVLEVAEVISSERPESANEKLAKERVHIVKILEDGVRAGEFAPIENYDFIAEMIQAALMKFQYPQLFSRLSLPQLRREFEGVMSLILAGLKQGASTSEIINAK